MILRYQTNFTMRNLCFCRCKYLSRVSRNVHTIMQLPVVYSRRQSTLAIMRLNSKGSRLGLVSFRNVHNQPKEKQMAFVKKIQIATYISCGIGACLLTAIGVKEYKKFGRRARGAKPLHDRDATGNKVISYQYRGYVIPAFMVDQLDAVGRFQVRDDDVWIVTFPKAGTTWIQEAVCLIMTDLDYAQAQSKIIEERSPYLEYVVPGLKSITNMDSPRVIKSHLPPSLLPKQIHEKKPKIIYMARNAKDTLISYYFFIKSSNIFTYFGDLKVFYNQFLHNTVIYGPWWKHVREGWNLARNNDNVMFITYEDMQKDLPGCLRRIADFLGKPLTEPQVEKLARHLSFRSMKTNNNVNYSWWNGWVLKDGCENQFLRKGIVGDWRNHLSPEMAGELDKMVAEKLQGTQLVLEDSLTDSTSSKASNS